MRFRGGYLVHLGDARQVGNDNGWDPHAYHIESHIESHVSVWIVVCVIMWYDCVDMILVDMHIRGF